MQYIINADDFGLHKSCSRAIAEAFSLSLITDTTMCANGDFFAHASAYFNPKHLQAKGVAEIMVHPDYDLATMKLIDRLKYVHGIPGGKDLCSFVSFLNLTPDILTSYSAL